jgi:DNA-binding NtrC family response regulator
MTTKILIVDDEEGVLFVLRRALKRVDDGTLIVTAQSAQLALETVKQDPIDLLITDLIMPDLDGVELTERVRSLAPEAAVIWITAYGCQPFKAEAERLGVYSCVEKPLEIHHLRQLVREALGERGNEKSAGV